MNPQSIMRMIALLLAILGVTGCGTSAENPAISTEASEELPIHGEWWCDEHGVPEEICAQCDNSLAANFKAQGDWCDEHDRPESQCFTCNPEKEAEFEALYEAKYGTKPPKPRPEDEEHSHHDHEEKS